MCTPIPTVTRGHTSKFLRLSELQGVIFGVMSLSELTRNAIVAGIPSDKVRFLPVQALIYNSSTGVARLLYDPSKLLGDVN